MMLIHLSVKLIRIDITAIHLFAFSLFQGRISTETLKRIEKGANENMWGKRARQHVSLVCIEYSYVLARVTAQIARVLGPSWAYLYDIIQRGERRLKQLGLLASCS